MLTVAYPDCLESWPSFRVSHMGDAIKDSALDSEKVGQLI